MDISLRTHSQYLGQHISSLPTPALVLSRPILEKNIDCLLRNVHELGIPFRPHVKTLKSLEATRMMLSNGKHRSIVASTICEIEGSLPLVEEGILDECLHGFPVTESALPRLYDLSKKIKISVMVDNEQQVGLLEKFEAGHPGIQPWQVFIKVDVGSQRAGVDRSSKLLRKLIKCTEGSSAANIQGLYCHAGHSYGCRTRDSVKDVLLAEIDGLVEVASQVSPGKSPLVLSIGSTPTAHSIQSAKDKLPQGCMLELHAGNFLANNLQQLSTGMVNQDQLAARVLAEVCSVYTERNEVLVNTGVIAMSRETSAIPGFGVLVDHLDWHIIRLSQEHGILGITREKSAVNDPENSSLEIFRVGQKVSIYCQHTCITASAFHVYYVVDENDVVCDTWIPWKGW